MSSDRHLESDYKRDLMARAAVHFPRHRFFSRSVALIAVGDRKFKTGIPGQADIYVLGRGGGHWELELKRYGSLSEAQERWRDWCAEWQIPWMCLDAKKSESPPETIARWVEELRPWLER